MKITIISGFLGAGKTTLIKHLLSRVYQGQRVALIENEFGEIGIDGGFLEEAGIRITEMNSGCICCSLVGDFSRALEQLAATYELDRILIEPSGVGKLSDVLNAVGQAHLPEAETDGIITVVDAKKCKMYRKNFGEFFEDQIRSAQTVVFSHTDTASEAKCEESLAIVRQINPTANLVTTPVDSLTPDQLVSALSSVGAQDAFMAEVAHAHHHHGEHCECGHHHHDHDEHCECGHHHHDHDEHCECGHHHHDHDEHCECGHHHHDHDEHCECGHHHHDHDEHCECGHHHHDHDEHCECGHHHDHDEHCECGHHHGHHHHHADDVFTSWGRETARTFTEEQIEQILTAFDGEDCPYGTVLRAKGIVRAADGGFIHFDYVPEDHDVRRGTASLTGRLCVIGTDLCEQALAELFGV